MILTRRSGCQKNHTKCLIIIIYIQYIYEGMIPLENDGEQWKKLKTLSCRSLITYSIWVILPTLGLFGVMGSSIYARSINMTYNDTTSYAEFEMMYGMGTGSMDVASLTNKAMTLIILIIMFFNPGLIATLISVSETSIYANRLTNRKTTILLCLFHVLYMIFNCLHFKRIQDGVYEAVVLWLFFLFLVSMDCASTLCLMWLQPISLMLQAS